MIIESHPNMEYFVNWSMKMAKFGKSFNYRKHFCFFDVIFKRNLRYNIKDALKSKDMLRIGLSACCNKWRC